jgi:hypothetical protein
MGGSSVTTTNDLIARLRGPGSTFDTRLAAEKLEAFTRILDGLPQDAIDGGWTALGMSKYAKGLETQIETLQRERDEARVHALADRAPTAGQHVIVMSDSWSAPMVLEYVEFPHPRLLNRVTGRWYWYPERMRWQALDAAIKSGSEG